MNFPLYIHRLTDRQTHKASFQQKTAFQLVFIVFVLVPPPLPPTSAPSPGRPGHAFESDCLGYLLAHSSSALTGLMWMELRSLLEIGSRASRALRLQVFVSAGKRLEAACMVLVLHPVVGSEPRPPSVTAVASLLYQQVSLLYLDGSRSQSTSKEHAWRSW